MLAVTVDPIGFEAAQKALAGISNGYARVAKMAINKGLDKGRDIAIKGITKRYEMSHSEVRKGIQVERATINHLKGNLDINGDMQPVSKFPHKISFVQKSWGPKRQVIRVTIIRGKPKILKGAFKLPDGRIMERRQYERLPIWPVSTIGIAHMAGQSEISAATTKAMNTTIAQVLRTETEKALLKAGGKKTAGGPTKT